MNIEWQSSIFKEDQLQQTVILLFISGDLRGSKDLVQYLFSVADQTV